MKIKAVCEQTGLSDRTVRYYIEEKLISPEYSENYLGRRAYDFSEKEISELKDIAVLRKFGFSIVQIRQISQNPHSSPDIIKALIEQKNKVISDEETSISAMSEICNGTAYSVSELAQKLHSFSENNSIPSEDRFKMKAGRMLSVAIKYFFACLLISTPLFFCLASAIHTAHEYQHPKTNIIYAICVYTIALIPSVILAFVYFPKKKRRRKTLTVVISTVLCTLFLPISLILPHTVPVISTTTDITDYLIIDADCVANRSQFFHKLFPTWPHYFINEKQSDGNFKTRYLDARYYYRYFRGMDYTYDIYAEWPLEKAEFDKEVERVKALYDTLSAYEIIEKENYTCYVLYEGAKPFQKATDNYSYYIFAYDADNLRVRYIYCDSLENGADQPYYLELEW